MSRFDIEVVVGKAWLRARHGEISIETYLYIKSVFALEYVYATGE